MHHPNYYRCLVGILLIFSGLHISAQSKSPVYERWELGLQGGVSQSQNDLNNFGKFENNPAGNLLLRFHFNHNFAVRANLLYGKISGDDVHYPDHADRQFTFTSPVTEGSLVFEYDILGHLRYKNRTQGSFRRVLSPYAFVGMGYTATNPETDYHESTQTAPTLALIAIDKRDNTAKSFTPGVLGLGLKFDINEQWLIQLESGFRLVWNDKLDAVSASGNPNKDDTYSFTGIGICYRFKHASDQDQDGVPDDKDACIDTPGVPENNGCPDSDGDGIADKDDACPTVKGTAALLGCPDKDGDGITDLSDACPEVKGLAAFKGCPDTDGDGIPDKDDNCPTEKGTAATLGCPDKDGDGIADGIDKCPNEKGPVSLNGCPDTDGDGIIDKDDACPTLKGLNALNGCPDRDGDGIADGNDKCPDKAGPAANDGCPEVKTEDKKVLEAAKYGVQFESGKSAIKSPSFAILDQVATMMQSYPEYHLSINGHTDNVGSDATNLKLSQDRAKACFDYLIGKGIPSTRMSHAGFGEAQPVADNSTPEGRAKNRRVEFDLKPK